MIMPCRLLFSIGLLLAPSLWAQPGDVPNPVAEKTALVERVLTAMKIERNLAPMMQAVQGQVTQIIQAQLKSLDANSRMGAEGKKQLEAEMTSLQRDVFALSTERMSWANMKPIYVKVYTETLSNEELRGLATFYESASGQSYVDKTPLVVANTMKEMQGMLATLMPEIQALTKQRIEEMQKRYGGR